MSDHPFQFRRPTPLEDKAYSEIARHFSEHLKQFPACQDNLKQCERDIAKTAITVNLAASQAQSAGTPLQTDDGTQWLKGVGITDSIALYYRPAGGAAEYAIIQQFHNGSSEILNQGRNVVDILRNFVGDQKEILKLWAEDIKAQVTEFLAEKYPGQDMSRVADAFVLRCTTETVSRTQAITHNHGQSRGRGIGI